MSVNRRRAPKTFLFSVVYRWNYMKIGADGVTIRTINGDFSIPVWDLPVQIPNHLAVMRFR